MDTLMMLASEEGNGFWLPADKREVLWGTLAFLIVMGLLYKFAWPSIRTAMTGRTERIGESLDEAAELRAAAEAERDEIKSALADSDTEAARIVAEARDTASTLIADAAARAEADAAAIRERIPAEIEALTRSAQGDLSAEVSRLSLAATEEVVAEQLDEATQQGLIESYISQIGARN